MVKGITRQVIVVNGSPDTSFDQAIFLVRDSIVAKGGVTEEALLREARLSCRSPMHRRRLYNAVWSLCGAGLIGLTWLLTVIF